jgi:very-short-patch-repair endonuclease
VEQVIFWIGGLIALALVLKLIESSLFAPAKNKKSNYTYQKKSSIMTNAEIDFFSALTEAVENKYYIFPQVHLPSILTHKIVGQSWYGAYRHIDEKSVDFVLCDRTNLEPVLAIELDDNSHLRDDRIQRDLEVERILDQAEVPLIRFNNHGKFNGDAIKQQINQTLSAD